MFAGLQQIGRPYRITDALAADRDIGKTGEVYFGLLTRSPQIQRLKACQVADRLFPVVDWGVFLCISYAYRVRVG
jgi:hypothetical protein